MLIKINIILWTKINTTSLDQQSIDRSLTMRPNYFRHILLITIATLIVTSPSTFGGNVYKFSDGNGNVLFTNVVNAHKKPAGANLAKFNTLELITWFPDTNVHNYSNWGGDESAVLPSYSKLRDAFDPLIKLEADRYKVERGLVKAVIHTESGFNPKALSKPGAQGLMQLMPATAKRYKVLDPFDPAQNVRAGTEHLKYLLDRYNQIELALAAYNAGEGNVEKYGGVPPFSETEDYIKRVMSRYHGLYLNKM